MSKRLYPILVTFNYSDQRFFAGKTKWLGNHAVDAIKRVYGDGHLGDPIDEAGGAKNVDPINPSGGSIATSFTLTEEVNKALEGGNGNEIRAALKKVYALQAEGETTYPTKEENTIALQLWLEESQGALTGELSNEEISADASLVVSDQEE